MAGAAAFGRLCVETLLNPVSHRFELAAAFGRLCVETYYLNLETENAIAAAFGRLCVETWRKENFSHLNRLRLQAVLRCNKT